MNLPWSWGPTRYSGDVWNDIRGTTKGCIWMIWDDPSTKKSINVSVGPNGVMIGVGYILRSNPWVNIGWRSLDTEAAKNELWKWLESTA